MKSNQMLVFGERGKPEYPRKNLSQQSREPNKVIRHVTSDPGMEPRPHWWKASALTTGPTLAPSSKNRLEKRSFSVVCFVKLFPRMFCSFGRSWHLLKVVDNVNYRRLVVAILLATTGKHGQLQF